MKALAGTVGDAERKTAQFRKSHKPSAVVISAAALADTVYLHVAAMVRAHDDIFDRPYFACLATIKRSNNIRDSGLTNLLEGNRVVRTIPSPT